MGFFKSIFGRTKVNSDNKSNSIFKFLLSSMFSGTPSSMNLHEWEKMYSISPKMSAVRRIAQDVAKVNWQLKRYDQKEIREHYIIDLLRDPNPMPQISWYIINYLREVHLLVNGEAFWLKERNERGQIAALWSIPPSWIQELPSSTYMYYKILPTSGFLMSDIPVQDMIYFCEPDISNPYGRGVGQLRQVGSEIETDKFMGDYSRKFFYNDAVPSLIISAPGITKMEADRFKSDWKHVYGGYDKRDNVAVISNDVKFQLLSTSMKELDFIQSRKFLRDTVNQTFNIPPEIMGIVENSNRATIQAAYYLYAKNVLSARLKMSKDVLNAHMLLEGISDMYLDYDNIVPTDEDFQLKKATEGLVNRAITINEWRQMNGFSTIPEGDVFLPDPLGFSMPVVKSYGKNSIEKKSAVNEKKSVANENIQSKVNLAIARNILKLQKVMTKFFKAQQVRIKEMLMEYYAKPFKSLKKFESKGFDSFVENIYNWSEENKMLTAELIVLLRNAVKAGMITTKELYNLGFTEADIDLYIENNISQYVANQADIINTTTSVLLLKKMTAATEEGLTGLEFVERVDESMRVVQNARIPLISEVEAHSGYHFGAYESFRKGKIKRVQWLTSMDERVRPSHAMQNNMVKILGEVFPNGQKYPGDMTVPDEAYYCRCVLIVPEDEREEI